MEKLVDIELAKILKSIGYSKKCKYFYQDKDLAFSKNGLKWCKNDDTLNHNKYDDFIYSAPTEKEANEYMDKIISSINKTKYEDENN